MVKNLIRNKSPFSELVDVNILIFKNIDNISFCTVFNFYLIVENKINLEIFSQPFYYGREGFMWEAS